MSEPITFGSMFAGIGGIDLGFERCGMECRWQVEIDKYANKVLEKHWPNVERWGDVRTFPPDASSKWKVDVVAGGFPCQDISTAGKGAGLNGEKSGLFYEIIRVARCVKPRAIVLENVAALLARGMGDVLGELAAIGFNAEWHCIPASAVGAPHIRDRVFILANASCDRCDQDAIGITKPSSKAGSATKLPQKSEIPNDSNGSGERWKRCAEESLSRQQDLQRQLGRVCQDIGRQWAVEPNVGRVAHGVSRRLDRIKGLGNAVVPQVAEVVGKILLQRMEQP